MTIKEAFEALSSACAKGMKNPFFVMKRLKESFADVADKVVDAGGSTVSVTAELTEGTKIATVTVDGENTDLYAPAVSVVQTLTEGIEIGSVNGTKLYAPNASAGGGYNYSTDEVNTGRKWIDGRDIFSKCFSNVTVKQTQDAMLSVPYSNVIGVNCFGPAIASGYYSIPVIRATMADTVNVKTDVYPLSITNDTFTGCVVEVLYCKISS